MRGVFKSETQGDLLTGEVCVADKLAGFLDFPLCDVLVRRDSGIDFENPVNLRVAQVLVGGEILNLNRMTDILADETDAGGKVLGGVGNLPAACGMAGK